MMTTMKPPAILLVCPEPNLSEELNDLLTTNLDCTVDVVADFQGAIDAVVKDTYALAITEIDIGAMSGIDLLAAIDALHVHTSVMLVDKVMTARSAMVALRMGAVDYLFQPLNPEFVLQRVQAELVHQSSQREAAAAPKPETPKRSREEWINPVTRPAAFILRRPQFLEIEKILIALQRETGASFAGLRDSANNIVSAAGDLVRSDLKMLKKVLSEEYNNQRLAGMLQETGFTNTYLGGTNSSMFITDFGSGHPVSLVVICPAEAKQGVVWLSVKRAAVTINTILDKAEQAQRRNTIEIPVVKDEQDTQPEPISPMKLESSEVEEAE